MLNNIEIIKFNFFTRFECVLFDVKLHYTRNSTITTNLLLNKKKFTHKTVIFSQAECLRCRQFFLPSLIFLLGFHVRYELVSETYCYQSFYYCTNYTKPCGQVKFNQETGCAYSNYLTPNTDCFQIAHFFRASNKLSRYIP